MIYGDWLSCGGGAAAESEVHSEGLSLAFKRLRGTLKPDVQAVVGARWCVKFEFMGSANTCVHFLPLQKDIQKASISLGPLGGLPWPVAQGQLLAAGSPSEVSDGPS